MDAMKQLVWNSDIAFGVVERNGEFLLIPLVGADVDDNGALTATALARGYGFCGVVAARNNEPAAICEPGGDLATMMNAGTAFAQILADRIRTQKPADDFVSWATNLHSLEDPR